jgi:hypothetical protein
LYIENFMSDFCQGILICECFHVCLGLKKKRTKHLKLFDIGENKIDRELDLIKIIKNL